MTLRLGISTCPNDTFAFHGLLSGAVDRRGLDLRIELMDIQELNDGLRDGRLDVAKASFHVALLLADRFGVLPVGSAVGFGVGPLLLSRVAGAVPDASSRVLAPGADTTATLLLRCLHPAATNLRQVHFAEIMPALARGDADHGVVIHEGRFTYQESGLHCVADLGQEYETRTGHPLPLGGLLAPHDLEPALRDRLTLAIRDSLRHAHAHRQEALDTMRRYAQELSDPVLWQHVDLYVSDATLELGAVGRASLRHLAGLARASHVLPADAPPLVVFDAPDTTPASD